MKDRNAQEMVNDGLWLLRSSITVESEFHTTIKAWGTQYTSVKVYELLDRHEQRVDRLFDTLQEAREARSALYQRRNAEISRRVEEARRTR